MGSIKNKSYMFEDDDVDGDDVDVDVAGDDDDTYIDYEHSYDQHRKNYVILKESEIRDQMEADVSELSAVLSIPKHEASILLRHYGWSVCKVHEAWFADESQVRQKVGLLLVHPSSTNNNHNYDCGICFESFSNCHDSIKSASCGHPFCVECWGLYIKAHVNDGPGCLMLKCPHPSCHVAVTQHMIDQLASEVDKNKYHSFVLRSFVEDNRKRKWCPAPNCQYAVEFAAAGDDQGFDVSCLCSHSFCWNCLEEPHRPLDCHTVSKWMFLNKSESQNDTWKKAYTKNCPKCGRPIEKNKGCMHMTCSAPCLFQFCWVCLKDWNGHFACNSYGTVDVEVDLLQRYLVKYQHYYDRWAANHKSREIALADLQKLQSNHIQQLSRIQGQPEAQLSFLTDAWSQIVECRGVLKWTFAYGYYLDELNDKTKKRFFEYLQGQAEAALERVHHYAEGKLNIFLNAAAADPPSKEFLDFRTQLIGLTNVTKTFFHNLVSALENGLSDVNAICPDQDTAGSSKINNKKRKYSRIKVQNTPQVARAKAALAIIDQRPWSCAFCTYVNPRDAMKCQMCFRGAWSCLYCTYANPISATTCQICSKARQAT